MIVGQIWVNGVSFSCHRFEGAAHTPLSVHRSLAIFAAEEDLARLGAVQVTVQPEGPLTRLRLALWRRRWQAGTATDRPK